jgi:hypothetical protein
MTPGMVLMEWEAEGTRPRHFPRVRAPQLFLQSIWLLNK